MDVLGACKYEEDRIKNKGARVVTALSPLQLFRGDHGHCDKQMIANQCLKIAPHIDSRSCTYYIMVYNLSFYVDTSTSKK